MENSRLSFLDNDFIAEEYYQSYIKEKIANNEITIKEPQATKKPQNDFWSMWDYGKGGYKVVYFKARKQPKKQTKKGELQKDNKERFTSSLSRTRSKIFELAMCNDFEYFCTFTQNKELRDRFDLSAFRKDLAQFVRNQNRNRENKIKYLLIPEQHQDGAWHMHGLLMGLTKNDLSKNEFGYLDWKAYSRKFGFFSVSKIKNGEACSKYITKYISKEIVKNNLENNNHTFFASQGLNRAVRIEKDQILPCFLGEWDYENEYLKIKWLSKLGYEKQDSKKMSLQFLES